MHPDGIEGVRGGEGVAEKTISPILPSPLLPIFPLSLRWDEKCVQLVFSIQHSAALREEFTPEIRRRLGCEKEQAGQGRRRRSSFNEKFLGAVFDKLKKD